MIVLEVLLVVFLHIAVLLGLAAILLGLGGNFILLGVCFIAAASGGFQAITWPAWFTFLFLALLGEAVEMLLSIFTARSFGATRWGMLGTLVGGLAGAALGTAWIPILGSLVGAIVGSFGGAFLGEYLAGRRAGESMRAGTGAFLGRIAATVFKVAVGVVIAVYTLKGAYALL